VDLPGLDASKLVTELAPAPKPKPANDQSLVFGKHFSDHILQVDWDHERGWGAPRIEPFGDLTLSPAAMALHYALQCFEGMKAYKDAQGRVRLFRPDLNLERLNASMRRLYLPQLEASQALALIKALVKVDAGWVPEKDGYSLYLRPTAIAMDPYLGLQIVNHCKFYVFTCPVGPYYPSGFKPIKLLADSKNVRAWPGGCGNSKLGGNYGPTVAPQMAAHDEGCAQVLWLYPTRDKDGEEDHLVTEVGAMNVFFVLKNKQGQTELVTAPLTDGTILPGVTRRCVLELARQQAQSRGWQVSERPLGMNEVMAAHGEGRVLEAFGCGTAAVIAPVSCVRFKGGDLDLPTGGAVGPVAKFMWDAITDIQYGRVPDHPWSVLVD